jgi:nitrilase
MLDRDGRVSLGALYSMVMTAIRVAVIQDAPVAFDRGATLAKVRALTAEAAGMGARLVLFPEAFLSGYPKGVTFGAHVGSRSDEGRRQFQAYWDSAVDVPGSACDELASIAHEHAVLLVIGVIEREGGTLYCSVLFFDQNGTLLGKHRKLMPTAMERIIWGTGDGSTLPVFETDVGRVGAVVCWENYMPLLRTAMYGKQIQIYCAPTVDDREVWQSTMRHIAVEGRCFVLNACQFARRGDFPATFLPMQGSAGDTVLIRGGSSVVSPFGEVIAGPLYDQAGIVTADIDLAQIVQGKFDLDVVGHYARPDIFRLEVNEQPNPPVVYGGPDKRRSDSK